MNKKGKCVICGRNNVAIIGHEHCSACYPLGKRFKWNNATTIAYRKIHPVGEGRGRCSGTKSGKKKRKYEKRNLKSPVDQSVPDKPAKGGFVDILIKAFGTMEKLQAELELRNKKINELEKERLGIKSEMLKSRYEIHKVTKEKLELAEKLADTTNLE